MNKIWRIVLLSAPMIAAVTVALPQLAGAQQIDYNPTAIHFRRIYQGSTWQQHPQLGWYRQDHYIDVPYFATGQPAVNLAGLTRTVPSHKPVPDRVFDAEAIQRLFQKGLKAGTPPSQLPAGWSKSPVDPADLVDQFTALHVKRGWRLRAYMLDSRLLGAGCVWALPENAEFPSPDDVQFNEFGYPKRPNAKDPMDVIEGDDSLWSYVCASLLSRQFREFGARWHGQYWNTHTIVRENPVLAAAERENRVNAASDEPVESNRYYDPSPDGWKWSEPQPAQWKLIARRDGSTVTVTFYTYSPLGQEGIYRHTDKYSSGNYKPSSTQVKIAAGPRFMVF